MPRHDALNVGDLSPIAVVGNCSVDLVANLPRMPRSGDRLEADNFALHVGGGAVNSAVAVRRLGGTARIIGRIGNDYFGNLVTAYLEQAGVENDKMTTDEILPTGLAFTMLIPSHKRSLVVNPGANAALLPADVDRAEGAIKQCHAIIVRLTVPEDAARRALEIARHYGCRTIVVPTSARRARNDIFAGADFVVMDKAEASEFFARKTSRKSALSSAALIARDLKCKGVIVTLGAQGAVLVSQDGAEYSPGWRVAAKDSARAGDIFCGAFARFWVGTGESKKALDLANAAAAISATRSIGAFKCPSAAEVATFMTEHRKEGESFKQL